MHVNSNNVLVLDNGIRFFFDEDANLFMVLSHVDTYTGNVLPVSMIIGGVEEAANLGQFLTEIDPHNEDTQVIDIENVLGD